MADTITGRILADPPEQNLPLRTEEGRKLRKAFQDEQPPLQVDYAALELRLAAILRTNG